MNPSSTSSSSSTSITSLPLEILLKILTGLPAKSAVRFRCTSKFFYSFIPEPHFAFRILVALPSRTRPALNLYSVSYSEESHGNLRADDTAQRLGVRGLVCSADGKMCLLSQKSGDEAVFDLSTRQSICLPSIDWHAGRAASSSSFSCVVRPCAVLGFDSVSERYKVFKSAVYYDSGYRPVLNRLWVLTVGVDKSWREIDSSNIIGYTNWAAITIHGIIYLIPLSTESMAGGWTQLFPPVKDLSDSSTKIVAMNVATESFIKYIPFPYEYPSFLGWLSWIKLNGCITFINILGPHNASQDLTSWPDKIYIWRLERSMEWEKQTVVPPLEEREVIREATSLGCTANSMGEIVFLIQSKKMISPLVLVYSFGREVWRRFEIHGLCNYYTIFSLHLRGVVHVEDEITTFLE